MQEAHCEWITGHVIYSFISFRSVFFFFFNNIDTKFCCTACCIMLLLTCFVALPFVFLKLFAFVFLFVSRSGSHDVMIVEHRKRWFHLTFVVTECISTPLPPPPPPPAL